MQRGNEFQLDGPRKEMDCWFNLVVYDQGMICVLLLVLYLLELVRNRLLKAGGFKPAFCLNINIARALTVICSRFNKLCLIIVSSILTFLPKPNVIRKNLLLIR